LSLEQNTTGWAACLSNGRASDVAGLRLFAEIDFAEVGGVYWVRGKRLDDVLEHELRKVPGLERFELLDNERLRPVGSRIPDRVLPRVNWRSLRDCSLIKLPLAALCGENTQKVSLVLVRTAEEQPTTALLVRQDDWVEFATIAALVRLERLRFAAAESRDVLVIGNPLPAIAGHRYAGSNGVLAPCGFTWSPAVDANVLRQLFQLNAGDFALLAEDNTHQVIRGEQFVPASRSAARITLAEWTHG